MTARIPAGWTPAELAAWRHRLGLTQAQAGVELGVGTVTLKAWEAGRRNISRTARLLAEAIEREKGSGEKTDP